MKKASLEDIYLTRYALGDRWNIVSNDICNVSQAVVIPAYAERDFLFLTLDSLAQNPESSREYSLVLCVVNNGQNPPPDVLENNLQTLRCLDALARRKSLRAFSGDKKLHELLERLADCALKIGYIDAATAGREIPAGVGGVGMARKIGMDAALRLLRKSPVQPPLIISLDADSLVENNYLSVIRNGFGLPKIKTAVVAYAHQLPDDKRQRAAIICYEIFLRYWVLGLRYAASPWAYHSIGSAMVTTAASYVEVRGMNKRAAGEDFYFLQKLAKHAPIHYIRETRVYPSARPSERVPFGTGKRIRRFLGGDERQEYLSYDPRIFEIIKRWLSLVRESLFKREDDLIGAAQDIHPQLAAFLISQGFSRVWSRIRSNTKDGKTFHKHFNDWFDGFKTLKLVNFLTRVAYPQINMFVALNEMLGVLGQSDFRIPDASQVSEVEAQLSILRYLREIT